VWDRSWKAYIDNIPILKGPVRSKPENENDSGHRIMEVRRQSPEMCLNHIGSLIYTLSSNQFCAGNSESNLCNVDCSSPLGAWVLYQNSPRFVQVGIATTNQRCNMPSIYTDVLSHIDFILRVWRYYGQDQSPSIPSFTTTTRAPQMTFDWGSRSEDLGQLRY